jgi:hypothetical protein
MDGYRSIDEMIRLASLSGAGDLQKHREQVHSLFERLYWFDQVVYQTIGLDR